MGETIWFDHEPTLSEICTQVLLYDVFKSRVKQLRPWGEEQQIIIPYTCRNISEDTVSEDIIVFLSRES